MVEPLISIIVPIYNVEKYLDKCIKSLVNQTYKNLEIILVDDGSTDKSSEICNIWMNKDKRIRGIHKENEGLSDARNTGLDIATGDYIGFIDSDDWIDLDFIRKLYIIMVKYGSDIVECGVAKVSNELQTNDIENDKIDLLHFNSEDALKYLITEKYFHQHVWNKLYKSNLVKNIKFRSGKCNEDEFWTYQVFGNAKKISFINLSMYYYLQRNDSIMGKTYSLKRLDALEAKQERQEYIRKNYPRIEKFAELDYYTSCVYAQQMSLKFLNKKDRKQANQIISKHFNTIHLSVRDISKITHKIWFVLNKISLKYTSLIRNFMKVGF